MPFLHFFPYVQQLYIIKIHHSLTRWTSQILNHKINKYPYCILQVGPRVSKMKIWKLACTLCYLDTTFEVAIKEQLAAYLTLLGQT